MSKYPLPSDDRLEQLIRESFEHMPGPQMARLEQIEQRLKPAMSKRTTDRTVNKMPWWAVLLLTGGFAAAAWWAGERIMDRNNGTEEDSIFNVIEHQSPDVNEMNTENTDSADSQHQQSMPAPENESPVIYQRESF
jgi:cytoskeletal protein RodZ